jgi:hypothetical protein
VDLPQVEPTIPTHEFKGEVGTVGAFKTIAFCAVADVDLFSATYAG